MTLARSGRFIAIAAGLSLAVVAVAAAEGPAVEEVRNMAGVYRSQGIREVAAEIHLKPDARFSFDLSYGNVDAQAHGRWSLKGDLLTLHADMQPLPSFTLGTQPAVLPDADRMNVDKPTLLVVKVTTPRLGMHWSNIEVSAEFSNGQVRSGLTGRGGLLGFLDRPDDVAWRGAVVRRVGLSYPNGQVRRVWFDIDTTQTRYLAVHFEPGSLIPPAFESMELRVRRDAVGRRSLEKTSLGRPGDVGWVFGE